MRDYNFFEPYQRRKGSGIKLTSPFFFGIVVIFLILALSGGLLIRDRMLADELQGLQEQLIAIQSGAEYQAADQVSKRIGTMSEYDQYAATALERIHQGQVLGTAFMRNFTALLPVGATLENASIHRATASFEFEVQNRRIAAELLKHLDESELFVKTSLKSLVLLQDVNRFTAAIDCTLKAGEAQ